MVSGSLLLFRTKTLDLGALEERGSDTEIRHRTVVFGGGAMTIGDGNGDSSFADSWPQALLLKCTALLIFMVCRLSVTTPHPPQ